MTAIAVATFLWRTALPAARARTYAFSAYYAAARLTLEGRGGVRFCEEWFFERQRELGFGRLADYFCPNPPTNALAMVPVAWLPPGPARYGWLAIDLLLIAAILAIGWRIVAVLQQSVSGMSSRPWSSVVGRRSALGYAAVAAVAVALYRPLHADLHAGQVYTLLALFYALWLYGFVAGRDRTMGVGLAGLVLLKLAGWPLWLLMIAARRWRALAWAIGVGVLVGLLTLPLFGLEFWLTYLFGQAPSLAADPSIASPGFQTLVSLLRQLFVYDARWSPRPLLDAPWLASLLWWALALALLALTLWRVLPGARAGRSRAASARAALAMLCLVVPLQPAGEEHHYTLLLVVFLTLLLAPRLALARSPLALAALALACVSMLLPVYYVADGWIGWPWALLAYPRMYGALLLWLALVGPVADFHAGATEQVQTTHS